MNDTPPTKNGPAAGSRQSPGDSHDSGDRQSPGGSQVSSDGPAPGCNPAPGDGLILADTPRPGVLVLRLNRPDKANSLSTELIVTLCGHLDAAQRDPEIGAVVLTGSERIFSAGADISGMVERGVDWYRDPERLGRWQSIQQFSKPLIAAVNGPAIGGGCELAMLCDMIIAGENARFGQGEINIGVIPGDGGTQRLPRTVGKSLAMYLVLTGDLIPAHRACEAGLVLEVVPVDQTLGRAIEIAARITRHAPISVQRAKRSVLAAFELPLEEGLAFEQQQVIELFKTHDRLEGMQAFLEKRAPKYRGS